MRRAPDHIPLSWLQIMKSHTVSATEFKAMRLADEILQHDGPITITGAGAPRPY
jgi:PHD/YefM family antitoxin component YafN of YafNO toxin-antitoxin module